MPDLAWDDLRFALALHRAGTVARAARSLGVNETTVARRVRAFEARLEMRLFVRGPSGAHEATDAARTVLDHAEAIEREVAAIGEATGREVGRLSGTVRISAVPIVTNHILLSALPTLRAAHPLLTVELASEPRNVDLTRREADLAVRFARPASGGLRVRSRKLGVLAFAVYGSAATTGDPGWIGYDEMHGDLPQARWLRSVAEEGEMRLRVGDAATALEAVARGLGRTLLPVRVARADARLREVPAEGRPPPPARPVWLLWHEDQGARASVAAAKSWLAGLSWDDGD